MHPVDASAYNNRWGQYHPAQKVILAGGTLLLSLILPPFFACPLIVLVMAGMALFSARVPARAFLKRLAFAAGFAAIGLIPLLFSIGKSSDAAWITISLSRDGIIMAGRVLARVTASMSCLLLLAMTTPLVELVCQFQKIGVPAILVETMQLIYRMLWLLDDTAKQIRVAQISRMGYCGIKQSFRSTYMLASNLFLKVINRSQKIETGLSARGYNGSLNVLVEQKQFNIPVAILILFFQGLLCVLSFLILRIFPWLK